MCACDDRTDLVLQPCGPQDQSSIEKREDVLVWRAAVGRVWMECLGLRVHTGRGGREWLGGE